MTTITGVLKDSGGVVYGAELTITLDAPLIEGAALLTRKPKIVEIPNTGVIDFELPESETSQITYYFELKDENGDLVLPGFHAIVPNLEEVNFWELYPVSALTDLLPAGLRRLAQIIATNPTYADAIKSFRPEGEFDADTFYGKGSLVEFGGGSYLYVADTLTKGKQPTLYNGSVPGNEIYWQTIATQGASSGLAPQNDVFNRANWIGNFQAPTKSSLAQVILDYTNPMAANAWNKSNVNQFSGLELLTLTDLLAHFVVRNSPNLTGDPTAPTKGVGDATDSIATCKHVKQSTDALQAAVNTALSAYYTKIQADAIIYLLAPKDSPTFTGQVTVPQAAFNLNTGVSANVKYVNERLRVYVSSLSANLNLNNAAYTILTNWINEPIDYGNNFNQTTGQWTCPSTGYYRITFQVAVSRSTASYTATMFKIFWSVTDSTNALVGTGDVTGNDDYTVVSGIIRCVQGKVFDVRLFTGFSGGTPFVLAGVVSLAIEWVSP
jgi:hypothetical protein